MGAQFGAAALPLGFPSLGPMLRADFGLSLFWLGVLLVAPTAGLAAASFAWGSLSDRWGERRVIAMGMSTAAAIDGAASIVGSPWLLGGAMVMAGAAGAAAPAASGKAVVGWFPPHERGLALSLRHTAPMAGGAFSAAMLPLAASAGGLRAAFWFLAAVTLAGALVALLIAAPPETPAAAPTTPAPTLTRSSLFWTIALAGSLVAVGQGILTRFLPEYLHSERDWSEAAAGAALAATLLSAAVLRVFAGIRSDRHGRRVLTLRNQAAAAAVALVVAAVAQPAPSLVAAILLITAAALTMAGNGVAWAAVIDMFPDRPGAALGLYSAILVAVITAAPPLFGAGVGDLSLGTAFGIVALFPLAGFFVFRVLVHPA